MMLNKQDKPADFIVSTTQCATVKEFAELSFREVGYNNIEWQGEGVDEKLINKDDGHILLEVDPKFFRPGEVPYLRGSNKKIMDTLGWKPENDWKVLLKEMIAYDLLLAERDAYIVKLKDT